MALYQLFVAEQASAEGQAASPVFTADTLAHAQTCAQAWATIMQRSCVLAPLYQTGASPLTPPWTVVAPQASGTSVSTTGISF